jgi:hypothetical protein
MKLLIPTTVTEFEDETQHSDPSYGLGRCKLCACMAFKGKGNYCEDCKHHYGDHATSPFRAGNATANKRVLPPVGTK